MKLPTRITSVNVGSLRELPLGQRTVTTGFFKEPVEHPVAIRALGLEGDVQADLSVHGGPNKAVYLYPREHYAGWEALLHSELGFGSFGENLTTEGFVEEDLFVGDVMRFGTAVLRVVQPRVPCYKLQLRFGREDMVRLFLREGRPGWYASVLEEGSVRAGDEIARIDRPQQDVSIADVWRYSITERADARMARRISELSHLPEFWKERVNRYG